MAFRHALCLLASGSKGGGGGVGERGLYFPIKHRVIDMRVHPVVAEQTDVQSRYRRELRSSFITGETRQAEPPAWSAKQRPTHFLSLKVPARCGFRTITREMWNTVLFSHPQVEQLVIPPEKLHVTLGVLSIPTPSSSSSSSAGAVSSGAAAEERGDADVDETRVIIERIRREVVLAVSNELQRQPTPQQGPGTCRGLQLHFSGLGTFSKGRVLFARCAADRDFYTLDRLVRALRYRLGVGLGLDVKGNPHDSYVPHITLAKIRPTQTKVIGEVFPPSVWADYQFEDWGDTTFTQLDLCEMKGDKETGYYKVKFSVPLEG